MIFGTLFDRLKKGLTKTKDAFTGRLRSILSSFRSLDEDTKDEIEETLLAADVGPRATMKIMEAMEAAYKKGDIRSAEEVIAFLKQDLKERLRQKGNDLNAASAPPTVILVVGVNGTGKTTSIAKLTKLLGEEGKKVLLCASDTFRAAAVDQITIWSERLGVELIKHRMGADPAAVVFDAMDAALARKADYLIVDTAGRLQTKENLMKELEKIRNVITRKVPDAPHEVLLVLDATTGQNAVSQADKFKESVDVTGLFLAKLDGTAKGGVVVAICDELDIPVKFVGTGEFPEDIARFDAEEFVEALFS